MLKNGRYIILVNDHPRAFKKGHLKGYVYEHILVAERIVKRTILKSEAIHHIDRNKLNNSESNLIVLRTHSDHSLVHAYDIKPEQLIKNDDGSFSVDKEKIRNITKERSKHNKKTLGIFIFVCPLCGKSFSSDCHQKFCSIECSNVAKRKVVWPSKDDLMSDKINLKSMRAIGRKYGITDTAVRKWFKKYNML